MKLLLLIFLPIIGICQTYPVIEEFNPPLAWSTTNGAGIQNYGFAENYLTTNIGTTPYPNSSTIIMTSVTTSYSNCLSNLSVSFPLSGRIENGWDYMYFEYSTNGGGTWTTVANYTGIQNSTYTYSIPNTANKFRFRLVTDNTINTYGPWWNISVYYYDIAQFTINCTSALPIELVYFAGHNEENFNLLSWKTQSEQENDYFELYRSQDLQKWESIYYVKGENTNEESFYSFKDYNYSSGINYYKLVQVDNNGTKSEFDIISIDNRIKTKEIISVTNSLGQVIDDSYKGLVFITYSDNTIIKTYK